MNPIESALHIGFGSTRFRHAGFQVGEESLEFPVAADRLTGQSFCNRTKCHGFQTGAYLPLRPCFCGFGRMVQDKIQGRYAGWRKSQGLRLNNQSRNYQ